MQVPRTIAIVAKVSRPGLPSIEAPRRIRADDLARPEHAKICASQSQRRQQPTSRLRKFASRSTLAAILLRAMRSSFPIYSVYHD
jgi:hypothetical protein